MKPVRVTMIGGPFHKMIFETTSLPQFRMMLDKRDKQCFIYERNEMEYFFDLELTRQGTARFEHIVDRMSDTDVSQMKPVDEDEEELT